MLTNNWQGVLNNVMNQAVPGNTGKTVEGVVTSSGYGISSGLMKYSPSMVISLHCFICNIRRYLGTGKCASRNRSI